MMSHLPPQLSLSSPQLSLSTKSSLPPNSPPCLESGRAILHESPYLARVSGMAEALYSASPMTPNAFGVEPSAFYPLNGAGQGLSLERSPELWKSVHHPSLVYPIDPMLAVHPYSAFYGGLDLNNAARRKNATRETTSALKAWLYEHRKNPYPTKGEKIMLAIITKMTLTQVSTWFANARRRLKKESKLGYKDKDLDDSDVDSIGSPGREDDVNDRLNATLSGTSTNGDADDVDIKVTSDLSDISDAEPEKEESSCSKAVASLQSNSSTNQNNSSASTSGIESRVQPSDDSSQQLNQHSSNNLKPKIWSIDEIMNKDSGRSKTVNPTTSVAVSNIETSPVYRFNQPQNLQNADNLTQVRRKSDNSLFNNTVFCQLPHRKNIPETALNLAIGDKTGLPDSRTGRCETSIAPEKSS